MPRSVAVMQIAQTTAGATVAPEARAARPTTGAAALAALGIVYGDLGTSPLYTLQTVVGAAGNIDRNAALGILSLLFWALAITISVKYCLFVMRADNHGEGGILALLSLLGARALSSSGSMRGRLLIAMGLFGAALIYGDGIITPAISVLSALEGVNVATSALKPYVVPTAAAILIALFAVQTFGTARIGRVFGPVMLAWFVAIGAIGAAGTVRHPVVVAAVNPAYAIGFLIAHGLGSFAVLGGVFLAITGGEALYADMGHIGRNPIRSSWYCIVLPALLLSYAGQTALLLEQPKVSGNPFFLIVPSILIYPMVLLATVATIIASQAIITGSFSLTRQAMQLGWFPGLNIRQTSDLEYGQIYVPFVNWTMMVVTVVLAVSFGSSDRLAGAYGTAVSTTMLLTTALLYEAMRERWGWSAPLAGIVAGIFLAVDLAFFGANLLKIMAGGWIPLLMGALLFMVMTTWWRGIEALRRQLATTDKAEEVLRLLTSGAVPRVPGTAVFLSRAGGRVPPLVQRHVVEIGAIQQTIITMTVQFEEVPRVPLAKRVDVEHVADGFWHLTVHFGFVEVPNLQAALACARDKGCPADLGRAIYFGAHDEVVRGRERRLPSWRRMLFSFMYRNAVHSVDRFQLPRDRFLEVGRQIEL
jgi:KUP system potassium uptake protein